MKIISGKSNLCLAKIITKKLNSSLTDVTFKQFLNKEIIILTNEPCDNEEILIIQSISNMDDLWEILLIMDLVKNPKKITLLIPYLGYSRQDKSNEYSSNAPLVMAKILQNAGINKIITLDLHSDKILDYYHIPIINIDPYPIIKEIIDSNYLIIAPDMGSYNKYKSYFKEIIMIEKIRNSSGKIIDMKLEKNVKNRNCFIIDDIIDSGSTLIQGSTLLKKRGANFIKAFATHGILSKELKNLSLIEEIYFTNSIPLKYQNEKFKILDIADLLINYL